jgi:hypothetical protein
MWIATRRCSARRSRRCSGRSAAGPRPTRPRPAADSSVGARPGPGWRLVGLTLPASLIAIDPGFRANLSGRTLPPDPVSIVLSPIWPGFIADSDGRRRQGHWPKTPTALPDPLSGRQPPNNRYQRYLRGLWEAHYHRFTAGRHRPAAAGSYQRQPRRGVSVSAGLFPLERGCGANPPTDVVCGAVHETHVAIAHLRVTFHVVTIG